MQSLEIAKGRINIMIEKGMDNEQQVLTLVKRISEDEFLEEKLEEVMFVPLLKGVVS